MTGLAISCEAHWQDGNSTAVTNVSVKRLHGLVVITFEDGRVLSHKLAEADVTAPMANLPLRLTFKDKTMLTVQDGPVAKDLVRNKSSFFPSYVEGNFVKVVAFLLAGTVGVIWALGEFVLPSLSSYVGERLPISMANEIGDEYFSQLRQDLEFEEDTERHRLVTTLSEEVLESGQANEEFHYRFMVATDFGQANAFALPNGHVIMTSEALDMLDEDEVFAVLAHEVGHVELRHSLKALVNATTWYFLAAVVFNDYAFVLVPAVIGNSSYSRKQELEADCYAAQSLRNTGRDENQIITALSKITGHDEKKKEKEEEGDPELKVKIDELKRKRNEQDGQVTESDQAEEDKSEGDEEKGTNWMLVLLSSHPTYERRKELLEECDISAIGAMAQ